MIFLALNIVFASSFMLCIKWVQVRNRENIIRVGAVNYIVAAVWALAEFVYGSHSFEFGAAVSTGAVMGTCYFIAYFVVIWMVKSVGASSTTVVGVLSILLPISCGILIWSERPGLIQVLGAILALAALLLVGIQPKRIRDDQPHPWRTGLILTAFFFLAGFSRLAQEAFKHESQPEQRPLFLLVAFVVAAIPSAALLIVKKERVTRSEFVLGFIMGASNVLQTHFILKSLEHFEGFIVFPATSAGGLVLTTLVATRLLGEKLARRTYVGIAMAVVALVMLNWLSS